MFQIDYEKNQNKKLEKDLKKTLASLEEERAKSTKHKQVAVMLIKEQKKLIERLVVDRQKCNQYDQLLKDEKNKGVNMAEGLVQESKKTLKMEAAMEKQIIDFDIEREQLKSRLSKEENKNKDLQVQLESLQQQIESLQSQLGNSLVKHKGDSLRGIEIKSTASPAKSNYKDTNLANNLSPNRSKSLTSAKNVSKVDGTQQLDNKHYLPAGSGLDSQVQRTRFGSQSPGRSPDRGVVYTTEVSGEARVGPVGAVTVDKSGQEAYRGTVGPHIGLSAGSAAVISQGGKVITVNVNATGHQNPLAGNTSPRKMSPAGRGVPPPLPPNKPILSSPGPLTKPAPPPKSGMVKDLSPVPDFMGVNRASPKGVHIPVSVVHSGTTSASSGGRQSTGESSPIRKPQVCVNAK